ncbi:TRADD-N-associated membrane domain-containing protein [Carboxylicivirga taeanensis]|uniref:TRADD-N-associated membrane domain-containing protein n=1 Tax=Carboxylicivirga taeanensis TaxID=1416875 RepID=UPI003F6E33FC
MKDKIEYPFENHEEEKFATIESAIVKAKGKVKSEIIDKISYFSATAVGGIFLGLHYAENLLIPTWILVILWILTVLFFFAALGSDVLEAKSELEAQEAIKNVMLKLPDSKNPTTEYFDNLVKINVENLSAYYTLVKTHTQQSFKVSLLSGVFGLLLISIGLVIGFQFEEFKNIGYISTGAGILIEFISGVLFYLYNKTVRQLKDYHDSLINVQNILLSFKLIESIKEEKSKTEMIGKMINRLVGIENTMPNKPQ